LFVLNPSKAPSKHLGRDGLCVKAARNNVLWWCSSGGYRPRPPGLFSRLAKLGLRSANAVLTKGRGVGAASSVGMAEYRHAILAPTNTTTNTTMQIRHKSNVNPSCIGNNHFAKISLVMTNGLRTNWKPAEMPIGRVWAVGQPISSSLSRQRVHESPGGSERTLYVCSR
jgi:hypothetical protein